MYSFIVNKMKIRQLLALSSVIIEKSNEKNYKENDAIFHMKNMAKIDDKLYTPQYSKREELIDLSHLKKTKAGFMIHVKST